MSPPATTQNPGGETHRGRKNKLKDFKKAIEPYFQKIKSNAKQIKTLTQLRDTLLPKLMSGEVRIEK